MCLDSGLGAILTYIHRIAIICIYRNARSPSLGDNQGNWISWTGVLATFSKTRFLTDTSTAHPRIPGDSASGLERYMVAVPGLLGAGLIAPLMFFHYEYEPDGKGCAGMQTAIR